MIQRMSSSLLVGRCPQAVGQICRTRHRTAVAAGSLQQSTMCLQTSAVRTEVMDRPRSPKALLEQKTKELSELGPGGWGRFAINQLVSLPIWIINGVQLVARFASRPAALFTSDPSAFQLVPPFPIQEEYITVNGIKLHAVSPGRRPDKPLMLFIHGFPELWYSWRHQMAALHATGQWDVVALDMRGYNLSDKPRGLDNYRLPVLASDVQQAVKALGHDSCTLVAHDWGGLVAWVVAGTNSSELVKQLVVMALPHTGIAMTNGSLKQKLRQLYVLLFQARGLAETMISADNAVMVQRMLLDEPAGVRNKSSMSQADIDWFRSAMCQPGAPTATLNYYRALMEWVTISDPKDPAWAAVTRQLDMPTLVLHGDADVALGVELLDGIDAAVPDVTVKVLKNCSHWVQQDYPEQVNEIMLEWLAKQQQQQQQ